MPEAVGKVVALKAGREAEEQEAMERIAAQYGIGVAELEEAMGQWAERVLDEATRPPRSGTVLVLAKG
jgi:hypothetical protein